MAPPVGAGNAEKLSGSVAVADALTDCDKIVVAHTLKAAEPRAAPRKRTTAGLSSVRCGGVCRGYVREACPFLAYATLSCYRRLVMRRHVSRLPSRYDCRKQSLAEDLV